MRWIVSLTLVPLLAACSPAASSGGDGRRPASEPGPGDLIEANSRFATEIYEQVRHREGNLALSPASISLALAMTWAGARGETSLEMARTFHFDGLEPEAVHRRFQSLLAAWNDPERKDLELRVANRLFGDRATGFHQAFLELTRERYGAALETLDFQGAAEESRQRINAWIAEATAERIQDLLPPGSVAPDTRLTLANAVYFKGRWAEPFDENATAPGPFHRGPADTVSVPTMSLAGGFGYGEAEGVRVLRMNYAGGGMAMFVILPDRTDGLGELEAGLDPARLRGWMDGVRERELLVRLPRFTIDPAESMDILNALRRIGLTLPFQREADFSGMSDSRPLFVQGIVHKAFVEVNEEGTEAAAATGVTVGITSMAPAPVELRIDHPFLFLIRDTRSGSILFMGRVVDPDA